LTVAEAQELKQQWDRHSRVPVYDNDQDDIVGIVLRKDVFSSVADGREHRKLSVMMHPVHFVPESAPLQKVMMEFFKFRQHLFVVVDEYGGFTGVISLEDIIEEIIGHEIMDESDQTKDMRQLARSKRKTLTRRLTGDS
ncbi:MAG: CBS domain-containing protein, partial [Desulfobulbaceae bacterium]|nr:CBS domain-containing protein [Desulfobulbaceae bacterium]